MSVLVSFIFFFQAEDGIRDDLVTGVQTCALPISIQRRALYNSAPCFSPSVNNYKAPCAGLQRSSTRSYSDRQRTTSYLRSAGRRSSTRSYSDRQRTTSYLRSAGRRSSTRSYSDRQRTTSYLRSAGRRSSTRSYSDRQRTLKWVLPTTLRVYGLRPSGKTKGSTASYLRSAGRRSSTLQKRFVTHFILHGTRVPGQANSQSD